MNNIVTSNGVLFIDGVRVNLTKGVSDNSLLYGEVEGDKVFTSSGVFYRGKNFDDMEHIGHIEYEDFLKLKENATKDENIK